MRQAVCLVALASSAWGCAHKAPASSAAAKAEPAELQTLRAQLEERDRRLNQLESRLALLEASQRELRYALAEREPAPISIRESVRIGGQREAAAPSKARREEPAPAPVVNEEPARPVLRLHEDRRKPASSSSAPLMPVPEVDERLPIAPVPSLQTVANVEPLPPSIPPQVADADDLYRRAIDCVRRRDFGEALSLLNDFLTQFPEHKRAVKVMFWRGEVLFAQRDYGHALEAYESALAREPRGDKAPDALLKIGLCHRQLGSLSRAKSALERLKNEFPESDAARMLKEEDAT